MRKKEERRGGRREGEREREGGGEREGGKEW